jgi:L-cysteine/cystine lyase
VDLESLRSSLAVTRDQIYMNTGASGPSPAPVLARMAAVMEQQATVGPASKAGSALNRSLTDEAHEALAGLLKAEPDEIMLTHGTTEGVHVVLHGFPWQPGDEMLTCNLEHSAVATPATVLEEPDRVAVRRVEVAPDASAGEIIEAIASGLGPRTRMVALSHVQYTCGLRFPIGRIARLAHDAGAMVLVDGAQTGGAIDLDMRELDVDFYAISGQKWLLGPQGTGALFVRRDRWRTLDPLFTTHTLADRRGQSPDFPMTLRPLQRYRVTSQNTALLAGLSEATGLARSITLTTIEAHSLALAARLQKEVSTIPGVTPTGPRDADASSGLVSVAIEGKRPQEVVQELWDRHRIAIRAVNNPPAIRFSLAAFNTESEVDRVCEAIEAL